MLVHKTALAAHNANCTVAPDVVLTTGTHHATMPPPIPARHGSRPRKAVADPLVVILRIDAFYVLLPRSASTKHSRSRRLDAVLLDKPAGFSR